ncbi:CAMK family protein kinase [Histomonas meleagridis]|uniref:CAMK family protein kinase n=1 Tax=Histomonas meleagridis TaxID=135588 RepID=UPI0035597B90|nr:CAMK family protein kinase [Histomonas meleagridis]KAH0807080.1 CAMK family protein kinase [Histomonas meleagridis]
MQVDQSKQGSAEIGPYILSRTLGEGITSKVKLARHKETGQQVAIKIISKNLFLENEDFRLKVKREVALMRLVQHPNIMKLYDVLESNRHLYIILEYEEQGELFDYLVSNQYFQEEVAMELFRQIVFAVGYLHSLGICHRDLKPENILLDANKRIKLADFGFARWVKENTQTDTSCGSPHYTSPEVISGQPYDGRISDIWSLGVILFALLAGYLPFDDSSFRNLLSKVKRGVFYMPASFSRSVRDLIQRMLTVDVSRRITIEEIIEHPAFRIGLMPSYIPSSPIPFPKFYKVIDVNNIPPAVIEILSQIGITSNDLYTDLNSPENNMTKVFFVMLTNPFVDLEQLPWECSHSGPPKPVIRSSQFDATVNLSGGTSSSSHNARHLFKREGHTPVHTQSLEMYSYARQSDINVINEETSVTESIEKISFNVMCTTNWNIFGDIQELLGEQLLQWFHPDPLTMYIRMEDASFYMSINAEYITTSEISLTLLLHKGDIEQFHTLADQIKDKFI